MAVLENLQIAEWAEVNRARALSFLRTLEGELRGEPFLVGGRFSMADISGLVALDFLRAARLQVPEELTRVRQWHAGLAARPSAVP
jgi:glutathione S-transferase